MKRLVVDLDETISSKVSESYSDCVPNALLIEKLREYKSAGFEIVIYTARNMRSYEGNIGVINKKTVPLIVDWLSRHNVPYDELVVGKPWCGFDGFYIDDKAIRPDEFCELSYSEILALVAPKP